MSAGPVAANAPVAGEAPPVIRIRGLSKAYRRGEQLIPVLEGIDLDVNQAEFIALMGPSGSGKSTLLNLIAGIDQPTGGTIEIGGVNIAELREGALADWRAAQRRLHLPVLQPAAGAERLRQRGAAAAADRPVGARAAPAWPRC
jgi:ABC-type nitrate/sulfonate/bicarbonate transport system ATPase subunit